jgi:hypothetical protein
MCRTFTGFSPLLEYVLNFADDVPGGDKSPNSAIGAVVAIITQDEVMTMGYLAGQACRGVNTKFSKRKPPGRRWSNRRFWFDENGVLVAVESFQILKGANAAILVNVIAYLPDLYLLIVDLESLVVVRNSVTWKTDYPHGVTQGGVFRMLEDDDISSLHPG